MLAAQAFQDKCVERFATFHCRCSFGASDGKKAPLKLMPTTQQNNRPSPSGFQLNSAPPSAAGSNACARELPEGLS